MHALIGKGKTGCELLNLPDHGIVAIFDSQNNVTRDKLCSLDIDTVFVFCAPHAFASIAPELIAAKVNAVIGTTAVDYDVYAEAVKISGAVWITADNFAVGVNLLFSLTQKLNEIIERYDGESYDISLYETHHKSKQDSPSGTAKYIQKLCKGKIQSIYPHRSTLNKNCSHTLDVAFFGENLTIRHEAYNRAVYAKGAMFAAKHMLPKIKESGIYKFEELLK